MAHAPEDKRIMYERERLEAHWRDVLTEPQRLAWLAYWLTSPPLDALGRAYAPNPPIARGYVRVREATAYAWRCHPTT